MHGNDPTPSRKLGDTGPTDGEMIVARQTHEAERAGPFGDADVPLVLEARAGYSGSSLRDYLSRHTAEIVQLLYQHGALLLRGFPIGSTRDFEEVLFSIRELRAMRGYFMAELGRVLVAGSERIFHSNAYMKTGGTLFFGGFHSENYYSSDVPAFIAFCCQREPRFGGETGIVHMSRAYAELDDSLRALFEKAPSFAISWTLRDIAKRYGVPEATAERLCREVGLSIDSDSDGATKHVSLHKPSVLVHPVTGRPALNLNVSAEIRGIDEQIRPSVGSAFAGPAWALHRLGWRYPRLATSIDPYYRLSEVLHKPTVMAKLVHEYVVKPLLASRDSVESKKRATAYRVGRQLKPEQVRSLAAAIGRHTTMVKWRRGDILLLDNLQMLHNGMPGWGERHIEAALCNPLALRWPISSGLLQVSAVPGYESMFARITAQQ